MEKCFILALQASFDNESQTIILEEHEFSKKFESKMEKLIKSQKTYGINNSLSKRVVCIIAAILILMSISAMAFKGIREVVADFFVSMFQTHSVVETIEEEDAPQTIECIYKINYDLSEFKENVLVDNGIEYRADYVKDDISISFRQYAKENYTHYVNTENSEIEKVNINGIEAIYFIDNHDYHKLIMDDGKCIIYLSSNTEKKQFFEVAESIKK